MKTEKITHFFKRHMQISLLRGEITPTGTCTFQIYARAQRENKKEEN